ncbi:hypothetical protein QOT17_016923 [Balamuthia mandrillaris]
MGANINEIFRSYKVPYCDLQVALDQALSLPSNSSVVLFLRGQFLLTNYRESFSIIDSPTAELTFQTDPAQTEPASFYSFPATPAGTSPLFTVGGPSTLNGSVVLFRDILFQGYRGPLLRVADLASSYVEIVLEGVAVENCQGAHLQDGFELFQSPDSVFRAKRSTFFNNTFANLITATNVEVEDCSFRENRNTVGHTVAGETEVVVRRSKFTDGNRAIVASSSQRVELSQVVVQRMSHYGAVIVSLKGGTPGVSLEMEDCLFEDLPAPAVVYERRGSSSKREFTFPSYSSRFLPTGRKRQLDNSKMRISSSTFRRITIEFSDNVVNIAEDNMSFENEDVTDYYFTDLLFEDNGVRTSDQQFGVNLAIDIPQTIGVTHLVMDRLQFYRSAAASISVSSSGNGLQLYTTLKDSIVQDAGVITMDNIALNMTNVLVERSKGLSLSSLCDDSFINDSYFLFNDVPGITLANGGHDHTLFVENSHISWNVHGGIVAKHNSTVVVSRSSIWNNQFGGGLSCSGEGASIGIEGSVSIHKNNYNAKLQSFTELKCENSCSISMPLGEDGCVLAATCPQGFDACSSCQGTNDCMDCTGVPFGQNNCSSPLRYRLAEDNKTTVVLQFNGSQPHARLLPIDQSKGEVNEDTFTEWEWQSLFMEGEEEVEFRLEGQKYLRCGPVVTKSKDGKITSLKMIHRLQMENDASIVLEQYLVADDVSFWLEGTETKVPANSIKSNIRIYDWLMPKGSSLTLISQLRFSQPIHSIKPGRQPDPNINNGNITSLTIHTNNTATPLSLALVFRIDDGNDSKFLSNNLNVSHERSAEEDDVLRLRFQFRGEFGSLFYDPDFTVLFASPEEEDGEGDGVDGAEDGVETDKDEEVNLAAIVAPCVVGGVVVIAAVILVVAAKLNLVEKRLRSRKEDEKLERTKASLVDQ